jgi:arsenate reductase-like glutaredoxin family protein
VNQRDLTKAPPSRAFLEAHVDARRLEEFLSRRSPIFKQRPLPKTKGEAIDLMLQHPNLIKRPVVVKGRKAVFGFDKDALEAALGAHGR